MDQRISDTGTDIPAAELPDQVAAHLQSQFGSRVQNLQVLLRDNGIVLRGSTETYHKQLVQHAVMDITGLPIHANEIEVH